MEKLLFSWERFFRVPIVGIIRDKSIEDMGQILPLYESAGLTTIEITMNTPNATDIIRSCINHFGHSLNIGAGTVCDVMELELALSAGAQFIVTPIINEDVIKLCVKRNIPVFPGAYTPTEVYKAWKLGANLIKIFPAATLGVKYITELRGPLNKIKSLPTGGVSLDNCTDFLSAGAAGVGVGSELFNNSLIEKKDWEALKKHFESFTKRVSEYKKSLLNIHNA